MGDWVLALVTLGLAVVLLWPRLQAKGEWRATVTPLASIIGSGFLVAGPILSDIAGHWAFIAVAGLCVLGYLYGHVIRHNIRVVEPLLAGRPAPAMRAIEWASDLALALAYFISVAYYLNLFAAFALRGAGLDDDLWIKALSTAVIAALGLLGALRGLGALERLETFSVGLKLAVIGGLCAALLAGQLGELATGSFAWPDLPTPGALEDVRIWLGLLILVQGFETSRYLGDAYDRPTRIRTMRRAQWIATAIYVGFILLATRHFTPGLVDLGGETAIIDALAGVGMLVAPLVIVAAIASQLSAAVADLNGAGGLIAETSGRRVSVAIGYLVTAGAAIAATWGADIFEIITYASKAFVLYYGLQSLQALLVTAKAGGRTRLPRVALFAVAVLIAVAIIVFATPVEA